MSDLFALFYTLTPDLASVAEEQVKATSHILKTAEPEIQAVYYGQQVEKPDRWTIIVLASSPPGEHASWNGSIPEARLVITKQPLRSGSGSSKNITIPLEAPCTEFFTCYGTEPGFIDNSMAHFVEGVESGKPTAFHGSAFTEFNNDTGDENPAGTAVRMLLGWDSVDAHWAERGEGKIIDNNLHYVASGKKAAEMFHVHLTKA